MPLSTKTRTAVRRLATSRTVLVGVLYGLHHLNSRDGEQWGSAHIELGGGHRDAAGIRRCQEILAGDWNLAYDR
jgi:hypothetical protein